MISSSDNVASPPTDDNAIVNNYAKEILLAAVSKRDLVVANRCRAVLHNNNFARGDLETLARSCFEYDNNSVFLEYIVSLGVSLRFSSRQLWIFYRHLRLDDLGCLLMLVEGGLVLAMDDLPYDVCMMFRNEYVLAALMLIGESGLYSQLIVSFPHATFTTSAAVLKRFVFETIGTAAADTYTEKLADACIHRTKCAMLIFGGFKTLVALQALELPALVSLHILDYAAPLSFCLPIHLRYRFVTLIKHFSQ